MVRKRARIILVALLVFGARPGSSAEPGRLWNKAASGEGPASTTEAEQDAAFRPFVLLQAKEGEIRCRFEGSVAGAERLPDSTFSVDDSRLGAQPYGPGIRLPNASAWIALPSTMRGA